MGDFKIVIHAVGSHGVDREKKDGQVVDFHKEGPNTPDALAKEFVELLKSKGISFGQDGSATITHWPKEYYNREKDGPVDDLLTGTRKGNF